MKLDLIPKNIEDYLIANNFLFKKNNASIKLSEINNYSKDIRKIIIFILKNKEKYGIDLSHSNIIDETLNKMKSHGDLIGYAIAKKVEEILYIDTEHGNINNIEGQIILENPLVLINKKTNLFMNKFLDFINKKINKTNFIEDFLIIKNELNGIYGEILTSKKFIDNNLKEQIEKLNNIFNSISNLLKNKILFPGNNESEEKEIDKKDILTIVENFYQIETIIDYILFIIKNNIGFDNSLSKELFNSQITTIKWDNYFEGTISDVSSNIESLSGYEQEDFIQGNIKYGVIVNYNKSEKDVAIDEILKDSGKNLTLLDDKYNLYNGSGGVTRIKERNIILNLNGEELIFSLLQDYSTKSVILEHLRMKDEKTELFNNNIGTSRKLEYDIENLNVKNLILFKINNFGKIDSLFGKSIGDEILKEFILKAKLIENFFKGVSLYQIGTTYFGISIRKNDVSKEYIDNILSYINSIKLNKDGIELNINFLFGIVLNEGFGLVEKGQYALQFAKKTGQITYYTKDLEKELKDKVNDFFYWMGETKKALKEDNIVPFFQGIHNNKTGEIDKFESLVRLIKEDGKIISPFFFLEHAKEGKILTNITKVLIDKIFKKCSITGNQFSINLTEDDLLDDDLINYMISKSIFYRIDQSKIILEILEDISTNNVKLISNLKSLRKLGFQIAIDDFGTGYSNFKRLIEISPDFIKIDGSLIKEIDKDEKKYDIVKSIHDISLRLGAKTVAEFVENQAIQDKIIEIGIDYSQGYLFSIPNEIPQMKKIENK